MKVYRRTAFIFLITIIFAQISLAQKPKNYVQFAQQADQENDFYGASYYYLKAYTLDSTDMEIYWFYLNALLSQQNYKAAENALKYYMNLPDETYHPEALFYLARCQQYQGKYAEAQKNYSKFVTFYKENNLFFTLAKQYLEACKWSQQNSEPLNTFQLNKLPRNINTIQSEFAPWQYTTDTLVFSAMLYKNFNDNNEVVDINTGVKTYWQFNSSKPQLLDSLMQSNFYSFGNLTSLPNSSHIVFTACKSAQHCLIYEGVLDSFKIKNITPLPHSINSTGKNTHPSLQVIFNDTVLIFSSNRENGYGGFDLYYSKYKNNKFEPPVNLGPRVNTIGNEITPTFWPDSNVIIFSSDFHIGFGGYDLFKVNGNFNNLSFPKNLKKPFNSSANDLYFHSSNKTIDVFLVSNRSESVSLENEACCNDIYKLSYTDVQELDTVKEVTVIVDSIEEKIIIPQTIKKLNWYFEFYFANDIPKIGDTSSFSALLQPLFNEIKEAKQKSASEADSLINFEREVVLNQFSQLEILKTVLSKSTPSDSILITAKAYCSPLASKNYNQKLANRRLKSLQRELNILIEKHPTIKAEFIPVGEIETQNRLLENAQQKQFSVYGFEAIKARRVTIEVKIKAGNN